MAYKVVFNPKARAEFAEAFEYYLKISLSVAEKLVNAVENRIEEISLNPQMFSSVRNRHRYRKVKPRRYPYYIVFRTDESAQKIFIVAFFHVKRESGSLLKRLRN